MEPTQPKTMAKEIYKQFLAKEGSQHIAGDYPLYSLFRLIETFKIERVLEIGMGIGCIGYAIMAFSKQRHLEIRYTGTEAHPFCLDALERNLPPFRDEMTIFSGAEKITTDTPFDLVIVDGADANLEKVKGLIAQNGIIYIEGGRNDQVNALKRYFPKAIYVEMIAGKKNLPDVTFSPDRWQSGGTLIFINPNIWHWLFYFKEKMSTLLKYKILRKINNKPSLIGQT